jgi:hypothetical protein
MTATVTIDARFNGPPASAHGGYSAGLVGTALDGPAEVTLLAPPPLERELTLVHDDGGAILRDGERDIAVARPTAVENGPAPTVDVDAVRAAMPSREVLRTYHPFPGCFGCGPDREPGDGLCLFAGEVDADAGVWAVTWTPAGEPGDTVDPLLVWAALDCPSSAPAQDPTGERPIVLGRFAVDLRAPVPVGQEYVILTAPLHHDGRKRTNAVWLVDGEGRELAAGRATWIELKPADAAERRGDGR